MIHVLIAVFLLGALAFFSFALGDEFGDDVRRGLDRAGTVLRRSPALLMRGRGAHTGPMLALPDVPPGEAGTSARRTPSRVENEAAAGGSPGAEGTWSSPQAPGEVPIAQQLEHAGAMYALSEPYLPPVPASRPVQRTGTHDHAPWETASFPAVTDTPPVAPVPYEEMPAWDNSPQAAQRLLGALRGEHPYPTREERALAVDEAQRLGQVMIP